MERSTRPRYNLSPDPDPNPSFIPNPNQVENEVRILSSLVHAHIITYHCSFQVKLLGWRQRVEDGGEGRMVRPSER